MDTIQVIHRWSVTLESGQWIRPQEQDLIAIHLSGLIIKGGKTYRVITTYIRNCKNGIVTTATDSKYQLGEPDEVFANLILGGKLSAVRMFEYVMQKKTGELKEDLSGDLSGKEGYQYDKL